MEAEIGRKEKLPDTLPRHRQCARGERERQSSQLESLGREPRMFTRVRALYTHVHARARVYRREETLNPERAREQREREKRESKVIRVYIYVYRRMYVHSRVQEGRAEAWYELPKLPFDSSDKLCKQFDRRSYRFTVEL